MIPILETVKVSAVNITHNEAKHIRHTLSRLYWCDEIIVVDSYSRDNTVAVRKEYKCTVYLKTFQGYGKQKQYGVSKASNDWILSIDADEVLSEALSLEIYTELKKGPAYAGYQLPSSLVFSGQEFLYGKETWRYQLRLFNKNHGHFTECTFGEKIVLEGRVCKFHHKMLRYGYQNLQQWEAKSSRRSALAARQAFTRGRNTPLLLNAYRHFSKHLKIRELFASELRGRVLTTPPIAA